MSEVRIVGVLSLLYVFRMLGLFMVFPVMMVYGAEYTGANPFWLGVALGGYGLTQAIFQLPLGWASDVWGRKPVICAGLVLFAVGSAVAASADSVWGLIIGRALQGAGAIASAVMALVGDLTSEQNRTRAMAMIGASIGLSFSLAMVLGPVLASAGGLSLVFWVASWLALAGIVILFVMVPSPKPHRDRSQLEPSSTTAGAVPGRLRATLRNVDLLRLNVGIFALHFALTATFVAVPVAFAQAGLPADRHWHYYLPIMLGAFIAMLPLMYIGERKRQVKTVFLSAVVILLVAQGLLGTAVSVSSWAVGLFVFFLAFNLLEATLPSLVSKQAPSASKGTAMGVYSTAQFIGASLGGFAGGWSLQNLGIDAIFIVIAVVLVLWLGVALGMNPPRYLTRVCVSHEGELEHAELMRRVPGIVEFNWAADQSLLYLKVDDKTFERARLNAYLQGQASP